MSAEGFARKQALLESLQASEWPPRTKAIPLTRGKHALVDESDYGFLMQWNWYACERGGGGFYATRASYFRLPHGERKSKPIQMHNVLMNPPAGMEVDHINNNPLDNRRSNLRVCIHRQNMGNLTKPRKGRTSSPYKGVSWHKYHECWQAMIKVNYHQKWLGNFTEPKEAAAAYNRAALEHFGEFAHLNDLESV